VLRSRHLQHDRLTCPSTTTSRSGVRIIGGYVYRGTAIPALQGKYLFSDLCNGVVHQLILNSGVATVVDAPTVNVGTPLSSGRTRRRNLRAYQREPGVENRRALTGYFESFRFRLPTTAAPDVHGACFHIPAGAPLCAGCIRVCRSQRRR